MKKYEVDLAVKVSQKTISLPMVFTETIRERKITFFVENYILGSRDSTEKSLPWL